MNINDKIIDLDNLTKIIKNFNKKKKIVYKAKLFILLSVFVSMFPLLPSGNYFGNSLLIISYLPFGFYLYIKKINDLKFNNNI